MWCNAWSQAESSEINNERDRLILAYHESRQKVLRELRRQSDSRALFGLGMIVAFFVIVSVASFIGAAALAEPVPDWINGPDEPQMVPSEPRHQPPGFIRWLLSGWGPWPVGFEPGQRAGVRSN